MLYKHTFINNYLRIRIHTNSKRIHNLVENVLDADSSFSAFRPKIKMDFYLEETSLKNPEDSRNFLYQRRINKHPGPTFSLGKTITTVTVNLKKGLVRGAILRFEESFKERLLESVLMQPLRFILASHGLFFLHASAVCKGRDCIIISGAQGCGKSTLALVLSRNGYRLLSDDDCFLKRVKNRIQLYPFPTKIGLTDKILSRYPEFARHTIKNYRYGGKRRLSLRAISTPDDLKGLKCRVIIFPRYRPGKKVCLKRVSKEKALNRLAREYIYRGPKDEIHQKLAAEKFWVLYRLSRGAEAFELTYNDARLDEVPKTLALN